MTDDERKRLNEIERQYNAMGGGAPAYWSTEPVQFLLTMAKRAAAAESRVDTFLRDRGADDGSEAERDRMLIEATREQASKDVARECARLIRAELGRISGDGPDLADVIPAHFALDGGPTLSERVTADVAQECIEIAEEVAMDPEAAGAQAETIINAISELFGLTAGQSPAALDAAGT